MKARRQFIRNLTGMAALFAITERAPGSTPVKKRKAGPLEGHFVHMVFFWLKEDTEANRKQLLSEMNYIHKIDLVRNWQVGVPANTDRSVVDNSWSCNLVLSFESKNEQNLYQEHPAHEEFIRRASHLWERVQVYDSLSA